MSLHVVVGAGPVGASTARLLVERGHQVRVVTRRGTTVAGAEAVAADAADAGALGRVSQGAEVIYNCVNPPYDKWAVQWPPIAKALLDTALANGAVLVTMGNLYGYGPPTHPMVESDPLAATFAKGQVRARMWHDALAAHEAGHVRVTEARAADFIGPGVLESTMGERIVPKVLAGQSVSVLGDPDVPHALTFMPDVARTLVALGTDERAWGRAWHVPTAPAVSQRAMVEKLCAAAGVDAVKVRSVPRWALRTLGLAMPTMRGLVDILYQFEQPFELDSSAATATFGIDATPLDEVADATVAWYREAAAA
jgi:nucleoside-diphosphate-sugar epimerase